MVGSPQLYFRTIADIAFSPGFPRTAATASLSNSHDSHTTLFGLADPDPICIEMTEDIPESDTLVFTTPTHLAQQVKARIDQCFDTHKGCFMLITGVGKEETEIDGPIDEAFYELGIRGAVKFCHFFQERALIINIEAE